MEQVDVGFNTKFKKWFFNVFGATRWQRSLYLVDKANIKLKNVFCNNYEWQDQKEETLSHGRLRFYAGDGEGLPKISIDTKGNGIYFDEIIVDGKKQQIKFEKLVGENIELKYNIQEMSWSFFVNGKEYPTLSFFGPINASFTEKPIRMYIEKASILYSPFITLFNLDKEILQVLK